MSEEREVGLKSCWKPWKNKRCRKPEGHEGKCAFYSISHDMEIAERLEDFDKLDIRPGDTFVMSTVFDAAFGEDKSVEKQKEDLRYVYELILKRHIELREEVMHIVRTNRLNVMWDYE